MRPQLTRYTPAARLFLVLERKSPVGLLVSFALCRTAEPCVHVLVARRETERDDVRRWRVWRQPLRPVPVHTLARGPRWLSPATPCDESVASRLAGLWVTAGPD